MIEDAIWAMWLLSVSIVWLRCLSCSLLWYVVCYNLLCCVRMCFYVCFNVARCFQMVLVSRVSPTCPPNMYQTSRKHSYQMALLTPDYVIDIPTTSLKYSRLLFEYCDSLYGCPLYIRVLWGAAPRPPADPMVAVVVAAVVVAVRVAVALAVALGQTNIRKIFENWLF